MPTLRNEPVSTLPTDQGKTPLVIGFDTSGTHCSAALLRGDTVIASRHGEMGRGQAERLFPMLEEVLADAGIAWRDLASIGVGIGPGNFTGIRIAVSAARGLALSLGVPAIGVSTLQAQALDAPGPCVALTDARRDNVYLQVFAEGRNDPPVMRHLGEIATVDLPEPRLWIGDHATSLAETLGGSAMPARHPLAQAIARIAAKRRLQNPAPPAPLYLRAADAAPSRDAPPVILDDA